MSPITDPSDITPSTLSPADACAWLDVVQDWLLHPRGSIERPYDQALDFWLRMCSSSEPSTPSEPSVFHALGLGLSGVVCQTPHIFDASKFDEATAFGPLSDLLLIHKKPIAHMSWSELGDTISALQMEFRNVILFSTDTGFDPLVDLDDILLALLCRVGFWALHRVRLDESTPEAVRCAYDADADTHSRLLLPSLFDALDAVHSMWVASITLCGATLVPPRGTPSEVIESTPLYNHHREASIDDFYELSMVADLGPGAVIQYKNKFRYLFHSISQVVYFHFPAYERQIQKPLHEICCYGSPACNLLPLIRQINPDVPVRFEHTGAGHIPVLALASWQWVLVGGFVVLVASDGAAFCAEDIRTLHVLSNSPPSQASSSDR